MNKQYFFLTGLPRCGSTLFTSILNQNPNIFASSTSPVCNALYWSSVLWNTDFAIEANPNPKAIQSVLSSIIPKFYENKKESIIIDKAFSWGTPENLLVLSSVMNSQPKFIVMDRPVDEILKSFNKLIKKSPNFTGNIELLMELPILSHSNLLNNYFEQCFVVSYERLCNDTVNLFKEFYDFIEQPEFKHNFLNIKNTCTDDDRVWGLTDMHKIKTYININK